MENETIIRSKIVNNLGILLPDRPIAFNRDFVRLKIKINGALFLSQCLYWDKRTKDEEGWFYKTVSEWEEETGLTKEEQTTVKKKLLSLRYLEIKKIGMPSKNYFRINRDLLALDMVKTLHQSSGFPTTGRRESRPLSITESTTESTTENYTAEASSAGNSPPKEKIKFTELGADILKAFETLNPACKKMYGNTTQRQACDELNVTYGYDRVKMVVEKTLPKTNLIKFFPHIDTPDQLWKKWSQLESAIIKARQEKMSEKPKCI